MSGTLLMEKKCVAFIITQPLIKQKEKKLKKQGVFGQNIFIKLKIKLMVADCYKHY
jgi:hypothetical protein